MPRKKRRLVKVMPFPNPRTGVTYRLRVVALEEPPEHNELRATLTHLNPEQMGRKHGACLPLPVHPEGPAAEFFRACGIDVAALSQIDLDATIGAVVGAQFKASAGGEYEIANFEPPMKEPTNDTESDA